MFVSLGGEDFFPQGELVESDGAARRSLDLLGDSDGIIGDDWMPLDHITFRIVRLSAPMAPGAYRFRTPDTAAKRTYIGEERAAAKRIARDNLRTLGVDPSTALLETTNCVISAIRQRTIYYLKTNTTKRPYMWDGDAQVPVNEHNIIQLRKDPTYMQTHHAYNDLLSENGWYPTTHDGLNHSQLIYFAERAKINIVIWVVTNSTYLYKRFDTGLIYPNGSGRVFHFHMDSVNHLTLFEEQSLRISEDDNPVVVTKYLPTATPKITYVNDEWFDTFFAGPITSTFAVVSGGMRRGGVGTTRETSKYSKLILQDGCNLYKHECTKEIIPEDCWAKQKYAHVCTKSDLEALAYREAAKDHNIQRIRQDLTPRLFEAAIHSDQVIGRGFQLLPGENSYYEYDMKAAYCADFESYENFPYFHGFPTRNAWSEYNAGGEVPEMFPTEVRELKGITHRTFDFSYGRYAIFQFDPIAGDFLDLPHELVHRFAKLGIFGADSPSGYSGYLTSPVLHYLTDMGVKWRASYVWVTHAVSKDWIPIDNDRDRRAKRVQLVSDKSYLELIGKMMCGRDSVQKLAYYVPSKEDAKSITYWYASQGTDLPLADKEISPGSKFMVDPSTCKFSKDGDITVVGEQCGFTVKQYQPVHYGRVGTWEEENSTESDSPWWAEVFDNHYPFGSTSSHISGAIHAYHLVRFLTAFLAVPEQYIRGFNVDAIKTSQPVDEYLEAYINPTRPGHFKKVEHKVLESEIPTHLQQSSFRFLSDGHISVPSQIMLNRAAPVANVPAWSAHSNRVNSQFTVVYGPAGTGKTTSHFEVSPAGVDNRVGNLVYSTYTNFLTHLHARRFAVKGMTSFRAMNRKPDDEKRMVTASKRYTKPNTVRRGQSAADVDHVRGYSGIFVDEATMTPNIGDTIEVCKANNLQLILSGDFDRTKCYQLTTEKLPVYSEIAKAERKLGIKFNWIGFDKVFRQVNDSALLQLLTDVRASDSAVAWRLVQNSNLFRTIQYEDCVRDIDPSRDMATYPLHDLIAHFTSDVIGRMGAMDTMQVRGNFMTPYKISSDMPLVPYWLARLKITPDDDTLFKGTVCTASKQEVQMLGATDFCNFYPYDKHNMINPAIGVTPYTLQGLTVAAGAKLYVLYCEPGDWIRLDNGIYTVLSRIQSVDQLVFVKCEN
jgi:hypothetical protein